MIQAAGQAVESVRRATLDSLHDQYRPLLIFAPADSNASLVKQVELVRQGSSNMRERQVLFIPLVIRHESRTKSGWNGVQEVELPEEDAAAARRRFHIGPSDFAVILIGKDGGEKFRAHTPVTIERLNAVIDAMPMRQQEVRNGNSK